jgi:hypothetical protein
MTYHQVPWLTRYLVTWDPVDTQGDLRHVAIVMLLKNFLALPHSREFPNLTQLSSEGQSFATRFLQR